MKKTMKKLVAAAMAVLMIGTVFAGCQSNKAPESDLQKVKDAGEMVIGVTYFAPMNYMEGDKLVGFETEFATAVCEKLGVKPKFVEINWNSKINELKSGTIDCIWNGMTLTDEIKQNCSTSNPYMQNKQVLITKTENKDKYKTADTLNGAKIAAEKQSAGEKTVLGNELFKGANLTSVDKQATALLEVKSGTADAAVVDYVLSIGSIGEGTDYADLSVTDLSFSPEEYGIAFRQGSDLTAAVNNAISELAKDGTLQKIASKYKLQDLLIAK